MTVSEIFPSTLGYFFEKIKESIGKSGYEEFGAGNVEVIEKILEEFKSEMISRGKFDPDGFPGYELNRLSYCFAKLKGFFRKGTSNNLETQDAEIFIGWAYHKVKKLQQIAQEIDEAS